MSRTALVVGGTGMLGAPVVRRLLDDGLTVRLLVRREDAVTTPGAAAVRGDVTDEQSLRAAMDGCDLVHSPLRGDPRRRDYDEIEHLGTARVALVAADAGVVHLTYLSHCWPPRRRERRHCAPRRPPRQP